MLLIKLIFYTKHVLAIFLQFWVLTSSTERFPKKINFKRDIVIDFKWMFTRIFVVKKKPGFWDKHRKV